MDNLKKPTQVAASLERERHEFLRNATPEEEEKFNRELEELKRIEQEELKEYELEKLGQLQRLIDKLRNRLRLTQQLLAAAGFAGLFAVKYYLGLKAELFTVYIASVAGVVSITKAVYESRINDLSSERDTIEARNRVKSELQTSNNDETKTDYFDKLVKINVENLAAYYELVKTQTDKSFRASLTVASFGAFVILVGLSLGFFRSDSAMKISYIATGAGVLTEFIAGVFFWLYSQTVRQLRGYHDSLLAVQNILLSFKLVSETQEPKQKSEMVSLMCQSLLDKRFSFLAPSTGVEADTAVGKGEEP